MKFELLTFVSGGQTENLFEANLICRSLTCSLAWSRRASILKYI